MLVISQERKQNSECAGIAGSINQRIRQEEREPRSEKNQQPSCLFRTNGMF